MAKSSTLYKVTIPVVLGVYASFLFAAEPNTAQDRFAEFMNIFRTGNAYQRTQAIPSFAHLNDPRVVPVLIGLLKDESDSVRTYAAQQLAQLDDKGAADALADVLTNSCANVRQCAAEGLAKIGSEKHVSALTAAVIHTLPDPNEVQFNSWPSQAMLDAISKLSPKAPPEVIGLLGRISENSQISEGWWRFYEAVPRCLGLIGDKAAYDELLRAEKILAQTHQDYGMWYAARKALAALDPQAMPFNRPAADILHSVREGKVTDDMRENSWIQPLSKVGPEAVEDLDWVLKFNGRDRQERKLVAIVALGEIGGHKAADVLRAFVNSVVAKGEKSGMMQGMMEGGLGGPGGIGMRPALKREEQLEFYLLRPALLALLKAEPNEETVEGIVSILPIVENVNMDAQRHLMFEISQATPAKIPPEITILLCKRILEEKKSKLNVYAAAETLVKVGGENTGKILSHALLESSNAAAAEALGRIKGYDAVPTLIEASKMPSAPVAAIAEAMGDINDIRTLPALEDMQARPNLSEMGKLWTAAALARMGKDYERNAAIVRDALPGSLEPAKLLHDKKTIKAVIGWIQSDDSQALTVLEAMGTKDVIDALSKLMDSEKTVNPQRFRRLSEICARIAKKFNIDSDGQYAETAIVASAVLRWFEIGQLEEPLPMNRPDYRTVKKRAELARELWIAEAARRLDLAAKQEQENYESDIPEQAVKAISEIFSPDLVPTLERIAKESKVKVGFHGKYKICDFYMIRSVAAKILTEKTGRKYTFVDVDGRTHPCGWNPSLDNDILGAE